MSELGLLAAEAFASVDPPSRIVMTVGPNSGHPEAATYDVIGLGDDAILGVRVHVLGEPTGDGFRIEMVELTNLCGRDVTPDGYCV
jgi:hypothetical protein